MTFFFSNRTFISLGQCKLELFMTELGLSTWRRALDLHRALIEPELN